MWRIAALSALSAVLAVAAGCASVPQQSTAAVVRGRAPVNYESTISDYFDLAGAPAERKLVYGSPETSPCALTSGGGAHLGWVVPVVYDTTQRHATAAPGSAGDAPV